MLPFLGLLLVTSVFGCLRFGSQPANGIDWVSWGKQMNLPGHIGYNPSRQTCCRGNVFDSPNLKCCGSTTYDSSVHCCCGGAAVEKGSGKTCCGQTLYDISDKNKRCCSGKVHDLKEDEVGHVACCGQELYRPGSQICCGDASRGKGEILPIEEGKNMQCCDTKVYDEDTQVCCLEFAKSGPDVWESNIIPLEGNKRDCCGGVGFDVTQHMCCGHIPVNRSLTCCGAVGYDPETEACCVHPPPAGSKYPGVSKIPKPDYDTRCCNGLPYKRSTQTCCDFNLVDGQKCPKDRQTTTGPPTPTPDCVGDSSTELCCGGIKVPKRSRYDVCCYDVQTDELLLAGQKPKCT